MNGRQFLGLAGAAGLALTLAGPVRADEATFDWFHNATWNDYERVLVRNFDTLGRIETRYKNLEHVEENRERIDELRETHGELNPTMVSYSVEDTLVSDYWDLNSDALDSVMEGSNYETRVRYYLLLVERVTPISCAEHERNRLVVDGIEIEMDGLKEAYSQTEPLMFETYPGNDASKSIDLRIDQVREAIDSYDRDCGGNEDE